MNHYIIVATISTLGDGLFVGFAGRGDYGFEWKKDFSSDVLLFEDVKYAEETIREENAISDDLLRRFPGKVGDISIVKVEFTFVKDIKL